MFGRLGIAAVASGLAAAAVWALSLTGTAPPSFVPTASPAMSVPAADVAPGAATPARPVALAAPPSAPSGRHLPVLLTLAGWATRVGAVTGIPVRALIAYGAAEVVLYQQNPGCHLDWTTLAGIGRVESDHGRFGGAHLLADGRESRPIVGIPLDGTGGTAAIGSAGGVALTGDPVYAHAVGPMQFLPSTWARFGVDGNGDGIADPQNIDDAALSAGRYLCDAGRDLATPRGWWSAVLSYNHAISYGRKVFGAAADYARRANGTRQ